MLIEVRGNNWYSDYSRHYNRYLEVDGTDYNIVLDKCILKIYLNNNRIYYNETSVFISKDDFLLSLYNNDKELTKIIREYTEFWNKNNYIEYINKEINKIKTIK